MAMRLARAFTGRDQDPEVRGPLSRLERPGLYQRAAVAERGGPGRRAGAGRRLARHAAERARGRRGRRLERSRRAGGRLRPPPGEIAAVIMEPVMVNGGAVVPDAGYLAGVRDLCRAKGALFICDEVITGFRVGAARRAGPARRHGRPRDLRQGGRRGLSARHGRRPARRHGYAARQGRDAWRHLQRQRPEHGRGHRRARRAGSATTARSIATSSGAARD